MNVPLKPLVQLHTITLNTCKIHLLLPYRWQSPHVHPSRRNWSPVDSVPSTRITLSILEIHLILFLHLSLPQAFT